MAKAAFHQTSLWLNAATPVPASTGAIAAGRVRGRAPSIHCPGVAMSHIQPAARVLTSATVTPSGVGISEVGTAAALVLFGTPPAVAAAGVLILGFYTYLVEIPAGFAGWIWVASMRRWRVRASPPGDEAPSGGVTAGN